MTAFSTASAPELNSAERLSWSPGVSALSASATSTYPSYGVIMKQVWVNRSTCSCTAATTCGAALPTVVTAIPEPKSISELPSASTTTPPPAATANTGIITDTADDTAASRRAVHSRDTGPGISVTSRRDPEVGAPVGPVSGRCSVLVMVSSGAATGQERGRDGEDPLGRGLPHADAAVDVLEAEAGDVAAGEGQRADVLAGQRAEAGEPAGRKLVA